jgi:hypothetical protein
LVQRAAVVVLAVSGPNFSFPEVDTGTACSLPAIQYAAIPARAPEHTLPTMGVGICRCRSGGQQSDERSDNNQLHGLLLLVHNCQNRLLQNGLQIKSLLSANSMLQVLLARHAGSARVECACHGAAAKHGRSASGGVPRVCRPVSAPKPDYLAAANTCCGSERTEPSPHQLKRPASLGAPVRPNNARAGTSSDQA